MAGNDELSSDLSTLLQLEGGDSDAVELGGSSSDEEAAENEDEQNDKADESDDKTDESDEEGKVGRLLNTTAPCRNCGWGSSCKNETDAHFSEGQLREGAMYFMEHDGLPHMESCKERVQDLTKKLHEISTQEGKLLVPLATVLGCTNDHREQMCDGQVGDPVLVAQLASLMKKVSNGGGKDARYDNRVFPMIALRAGGHAVTEIDSYHLHFVCTAYVAACNGPCIQHGSVQRPRYQGTPMNCVSERRIGGCQSLISNHSNNGNHKWGYTLEEWDEDCANTGVINFA